MKKHVNLAVATIIAGTMLFSTGMVQAADLGTTDTTGAAGRTNTIRTIDTNRINDTGAPTRTNDTGAPTRTNDTGAPTRTNDTGAPTRTNDTGAPTRTNDTGAPTRTNDTGAPTRTNDTGAPTRTNDTGAPTRTNRTNSTTGTIGTHSLGNFNEDIEALVRNNVISQETANRMISFLAKNRVANARKSKADAMTGTVRFEQSADGSIVCAVKKQNGDTVYFEQKADGSTAYYEKTLENALVGNLSDLYPEMVKLGILTEGELASINNYTQINK